MKLTALIIEDEIKGRDTLRNLLARFCPNVILIGEVMTVRQGVDIIKKEKPDIVFLDIELPEQNGFMLLEYFPDPIFDIIFTTAYSDFAIQAFQISAVDYLLKPINFELLKQAVDKVISKKTLLHKKDRLKSLSGFVNGELFSKIALPVRQGYIFIESNQIIYCVADRNYTLFYLENGKKEMVSKPLRHFEQILSYHHFFRINRSVIINLSFLEEYLRTKTGEVVLKNGKIFTVSNQKKKQFLKRLNLLE